MVKLKKVQINQEKKSRKTFRSCVRLSVFSLAAHIVQVHYANDKVHLWENYLYVGLFAVVTACFPKIIPHC